MIVAHTRRSSTSIACRPVLASGELSHADRQAVTFRVAADLALALDALATVGVDGLDVVVESEVPTLDAALELVVRAALALRSYP